MSWKYLVFFFWVVYNSLLPQQCVLWTALWFYFPFAWFITEKWMKIYWNNQSNHILQCNSNKWMWCIPCAVLQKIHLFFEYTLVFCHYFGTLEIKMEQPNLLVYNNFIPSILQLIVTKLMITEYGIPIKQNSFHCFSNIWNQTSVWRRKNLKLNSNIQK